jgi:hypothetical protein
MAAARHGAGLRTLRGTVGYYGIDREGAEGACCCARCSTGILNHESMSASCAQPSKESYLNLSTHKHRPADLHAAPKRPKPTGARGITSHRPSHPPKASAAMDSWTKPGTPRSDQRPLCEQMGRARRNRRAYAASLQAQRIRFRLDVEQLSQPLSCCGHNGRLEFIHLPAPAFASGSSGVQTSGRIWAHCQLLLPRRPRRARKPR